MLYRSVTLCLVALTGAACASHEYQSPAPSRAEVRDVRAQFDIVNLQRRALSLDQARAIASPIFASIAQDAARICRTVSKADSCKVPVFDVIDADYINAWARFDQHNAPGITVTRALIELLADQPDEIALVIGHEYAHLITAHVELPEPGDGMATDVLNATLAVLGAAAATSTNHDNGYYRSSRQSSRGPVYSQREIDEYLAAGHDPEGVYVWFPRGEELEADYLATYLATRSGYAPTGVAFIEIGALERLDELSPEVKQDRGLAFEYWDTHSFSADRAARVQETLEEIDSLRALGYARPIPPKLILDITGNNEAFHSLEELVAPAP